MISHDAASASEILRHGHSESRIGVSAERFLNFLGIADSCHGKVKTTASVQHNRLYA